MELARILLTLTLLFLTTEAEENNQNVSTAMDKHGVVPDVIDTAPTEKLQVTYGEQNVNLGNELTPTQVKNIPTVGWNADEDAFYLLCMTDPDAPSRSEPIRREFRHWLVGNIPGSKVAQGKTLTEYVGSGPPKDTGLHRYVFLLYKQPGKIDFEEPHISNRSIETRPNFAIKNFAKKYNLGNPVAGNFYQAQYDDYVPTVHKQFSALTAMREHGVVPDIIDTAPPEILKVTYGKISVNLGNELTPTQVQDIPTVGWNADEDAYYLLCMTDPDAPSRANPIRREIRHWLVGNIPGNKVSQGETLTEYVGSGPPKDTGLHRYVFLVYKQPGKIDYEEPHIGNRSLNTRPQFSIKNFAKKYNLGNPVAGNLYQAQYDDYVPILHAQFSVSAVMEDHGVVPDIIDKPPVEVLEVTYGNVSVNLGNELTPTQVKDIPTLHWNTDEDGDDAYYLLCMTDPDTPSRDKPVRREFRHWMVGNIPGNKVDQGEILSDYVGAGPPKSSGLHRYVFLVYKQPGKITYEEHHINNRTIGDRRKFSIKKFSQKYNLGDPVAGNLFQAQYDSYVPTLYGQFSQVYRILNFVLGR